MQLLIKILICWQISELVFTRVKNRMNTWILYIAISCHSTVVHSLYSVTISFVFTTINVIGSFVKLLCMLLCPMVIAVYQKYYHFVELSSIRCISMNRENIDIGKTRVSILCLTSIIAHLCHNEHLSTQPHPKLQTNKLA